jgi:hypothetical protein
MSETHEDSTKYGPGPDDREEDDQDDGSATAEGTGACRSGDDDDWWMKNQRDVRFETCRLCGELCRADRQHICLPE